MSSSGRGDQRVQPGPYSDGSGSTSMSSQDQQSDWTFDVSDGTPSSSNTKEFRINRRWPLSAITEVRQETTLIDRSKI